MSDQEQHLERSAERIEKVADRTYPLLRLMAFGMVILLVVIIGLAVLVQRTGRTLSAVQDDVEHLEQFVEELEAARAAPERGTSSDAIQQAVALVPVILQVLCEANPEVPSCQGVSG